MLQKLKQNKYARLTVRLLVAALICFLVYYFTLPPINPCDRGFWIFLTFVLVVFALALGVFDFSPFKKGGNAAKASFFEHKNQSGKPGIVSKTKFARIFVWLIPIPIAVLILGSIFSSTVFNANRYAKVITVNEGVFEDEMPEVNQVTNIALLDTESARILGTRKLGALADVVSQFVVSSEYTQINFRNQPMKVANLEYDGFFKWFNNRANGVPGYIMVDAVGNSAEYNELDEGMKYTESAYFSEDLERKLRFMYPTKIFDSISFEADDEGNVFFVVSCASPKVGLFGAMDITEVILFNPVDGTSVRYDVEDVPKWVDIVYDGYLACEKYDWQGIYSGGFFNSIIGQKGCRQTTDDFGYLMLDDDVWYFTGVTSVTADESNIGFILSCARTGEYKFYPVIGAEEYSAMGAAQGEVQEKEYVASFPALVNIAGEPTYIMVLKDANALVKLYALVNVKQYNIVATGETQSAAITAYINRLSQSGVDTSGSAAGNEVDFVAANVQYLTLSGTTYVYITSDDGAVYRVEFNKENEGIIFVNEGSRLKVNATLDEASGIYVVHSWELSAGE